MPMYSYRCCECGHEAEEFRQMKDATAVGACVVCPTCNSPAYQRLADYVHTDLKEFHTPIDMYSIALDTDEAIRAFKQQVPGVDVAEDPADPMYGVPIARSRKQKMDALKHAGFVENN